MCCTKTKLFLRGLAWPVATFFVDYDDHTLSKFFRGLVHPSGQVGEPFIFIFATKQFRQILSG